MPLEVFYSYAHEDETLRSTLEEHLATLKRQGAIVGWHDRAIGGGQEWRHEIDEHVRSAHIILLLISSSFLASDYCHEVEMRLALERHAEGEAVVIPVILRPVDWSGAEFAHLQALPLNAKPVTTWLNQDEAFLDIALGIRRVVERFGASKPAAGVEAPRAAAQVSGPLRPLEYSPGGIRPVPVVDVLPRSQPHKAASKLGVAALSSAGLGAAIWFATQGVQRPSELPPVASLEACYEQVFRQAKIEKTSGLVDATLALLDGNISAKTSGERVALYRQLDSEAVRQSIDGCNQQYNRKGLEVPIVVNLQASYQPLADAKISLRNRLSSPVVTNADGKASLSIPLAAIERETVPLAVEWLGARFNLDATLIDLEHGKPLDLGKVGTLEMRIVAPSCGGQAALPAQSVVLHLPADATARVWTADGPRDPTAPLRADVVDGLARFQYRGSLDAFEITVEGSGIRESYGRPPASRDQFEIVFPKGCSIIKSAPKRRCPTLEDEVQQRLAKHRGASISTVTITPTASGFRCSIPPVCDGLAGLFESKWRDCSRFVANVRTN